MQCSKCGAEVPVESKFCMSCGQAVSAEGVEARHAVETRKRTTLWAILAGILIVVVAAVVLAFMTRGNKVTQATPVPNPQQAPVVNAPPMPDQPQPSVLDTDVKNEPLEVRKEEKPAPPADVVAYLEHLKRVEQMRQDVTARELNYLVSEASNIIVKVFPFNEEWDESSAQRELSKQAQTFSKDWQQISAHFLSVQAPQPCAQLAGRYYQALRTFVGFMGKFEDAVNRKDMAGLQSMRRDQVTVDQELNAADRELDQVCRKFGIEKAFSIKSDTGQTPLLGF